MPRKPPEPCDTRHSKKGAITKRAIELTFSALTMSAIGEDRFSSPFFAVMHNTAFI